MYVKQLLPPPELMGHAGGTYDGEQFSAIGAEFLGHFRELADLQPNARVLDLGCGCGRMALALANYLNAAGSYEGIDIDAASISWATEHITGRYPNFCFQRADVSNTTYNPQGQVRPHQYRLPFADNSFDFVFLTSVFTHMLPRGMENYLAQIARVLKVKGKCLITMFLLNAEVGQRISVGAASFQFPYRLGDCCVRDIQRPEDVVAYDEASVVRKIRSEGLKLLHAPFHGKWSGNPQGLSRQDILIMQKVRRVGAIRRLLRWWRPANGDDQAQFVAEPTFAKAAA